MDKAFCIKDNTVLCVDIRIGSVIARGDLHVPASPPLLAVEAPACLWLIDTRIRFLSGYKKTCFCLWRDITNVTVFELSCNLVSYIRTSRLYQTKCLIMCPVHVNHSGSGIKGRIQVWLFTFILLFHYFDNN